MNLEERLKKLRTLKLKRDDAKEEYQRYEAEFKQHQTETLEYMEENNVEGHKNDGVNFVPTETIYGQINDRAAFVEWAEENNDELLEPKERASILNEYARQLIDDGEEFPPGMGMRVQKYIAQRSA